eukprot:1074285-Prorocentrum_minimum.AAC.2
MLYLELPQDKRARLLCVHLLPQRQAAEEVLERLGVSCRHAPGVHHGVAGGVARQHAAPASDALLAPEDALRAHPGGQQHVPAEMRPASLF